MVQQKTRVKVRFLVFLVLNVGGGVSGPAAAGTATASMEVSLHVTSDCTVASEPLAFGSVTAAEAPGRGAASSIEVACTQSTPFLITLDDGLHPGSGTRRAFDPATGQYVSYDIYTDAGHTQRWGERGIGSEAGTADATAVKRLSAYGMISRTGQIAAGDYRDVVTVMVTF